MAEKTRCEECNRDFPSQDALTMHNSVKHPMNNKPKKSYKKTVFIGIIISALLIGGLFLFSDRLSISGNNIQESIGELQRLTISFKNYNYYPNTITVKEGVPVEITLDNTVKGCYRSFNIKDLGVSQYSSGPDNKIAFTPNKKGTFKFECSMGMGRGTIIVE